MLPDLDVAGARLHCGPEGIFCAHHRHTLVDADLLRIRFVLLELSVAALRGIHRMLPTNSISNPFKTHKEPKEDIPQQDQRCPHRFVCFAECYQIVDASR